MKIRVMGTKAECDQALRFYEAFGYGENVISCSVSGMYPNRGSVNQYRVYVEVICKDETNIFGEVFKADRKGYASPKKYGRITEGFVLREFVGNGDLSFDGGTVQFALSTGAATSAPMVTFENRTFVLEWEDIIELASIAGLFDEAVVPKC